MKKIIVILSVLIGSLMLVGFEQANQRTQETQDNELVVILNKANTLESMSTAQVKLFYLRKIKKRWPKMNKNILPTDRKGTPAEKQEFLSKVLKMSSAEFKRYNVTAQYQYATMPPQAMASDKEVIEYVKKNVGGIGYVRKSSLSSGDLGAVKIVFTIE